MSDLFNFPVKTKEGVFSSEEYDAIYNYILPIAENIPFASEQGEGYFNAPDVGYYAIPTNFPQSVYDRIHSTAEELSGYKLEKDFQIHFARYTLNTGYAPQLRPHYDEMLTKETITLSIQLKANIEWLLYANGEPVMMRPNDAVVFSGSHQIHWRPIRVFSPEEYLDVLVCQLPLIDGAMNPENHQETMWKIREPFIELYGSLE